MDRIPSQKRVKRALSLIEVGIALLLTSILLTVVLSIYAQIPRLEKNIEKTKKEFAPQEYTHVKLSSIFSRVIPQENLSKKSKKHFPLKLYSSEDDFQFPSLFLIIDNGIDLDPSYCGEVIGRIFLDKNNKLSFTIWPLEDKTNYRKDILMENITEIKWEFFDPTPNEPEELNYNPKLKLPHWINNWDKKSTLPPMVRLICTDKEEKKEIFNFFLSSGFDMICY